ncbi:MAG: hypothetical protein ACSLE9_07965 [Burkholderiaceae bacterium]
MATFLKQSTAVDIMLGPFVDNVDGNTVESGLTITQPDIRLSKNGGAFAQKSAAQTLSHGEAGWYSCNLSTTDTNTLGSLVVAVHESGALPVWREFTVLPATVYDAFVSATGNGINANVISWNSTVVATPSVAGVPEVDLTHVEGADASTYLEALDNAMLAAIAALNNLSPAQVNAEVLDVLNVDTFAMLGQAAPSATPTLREAILFLYKLARNKVDQSATELKVYADDASTVDQKATVGDSGTVFTRGEIGAGP